MKIEKHRNCQESEDESMLPVRKKKHNPNALAPPWKGGRGLWLFFRTERHALIDEVESSHDVISIIFCLLPAFITETKPWGRVKMLAFRNSHSRRDWYIKKLIEGCDDDVYRRRHGQAGRQRGWMSILVIS